MQDVLHYSAIETGVAYLTLTLAIIIFAAVAQGLVTRVGVRRVLPVGLALSAAGLVLFTQLPVDGHYFWDIFPGFLVSGIGLALSFVPMTIAALIGVDETDAGIASGLINTSQQIGGAVGLAAATTIAVTFTNRYLDSHAGLVGIERRCARLRLPDRLLGAGSAGRNRIRRRRGDDRAERPGSRGRARVGESSLRGGHPCPAT